MLKKPILRFWTRNEVFWGCPPLIPGIESDPTELDLHLMRVLEEKLHLKKEFVDVLEGFLVPLSRGQGEGGFSGPWQSHVLEGRNGC